MWAVIIAVVLSVFFCGPLSKIRWIFRSADSLGLAMYAVIGTQKSLNQGLGIMASILIGTLNAIGGGLIRDIFTQEQVSLFKPGELYAIIAFGGSLVFAILSLHTPLPRTLSGALVVIAVVLTRFFVRRYRLQTKPLKPRGYDSSHW